MFLLKSIQEQTGVKFLLALKGFASWAFFDEMTDVLYGVAASSTHEARLGKEEFAGGEIHVYSPAYKESELEQLASMADHIIFNSFNQWKRFRGLLEGADRKINVGLRINPEYSEVRTEIYNPCTNLSRFGIRRGTFEGESLDGISGLHFHTMCQQGPAVLHRTLDHVERLFGEFFPRIQWINFGGGHHTTREGYDIAYLCELLCEFRNRTGLDVYLEPGEAHVLNTGFLVTTVLDVIENAHSNNIAIVDTSAAAHMPDILEMPYTPEMIGGEIVRDDLTDYALEDYDYKYVLGGKTCLSGDVIGEYGLGQPLAVGDRVTLSDMAQYTIVRNTTFNGIPLPAIVSVDTDLPDGDVRVLRQFGYEDFKGRLC